MEVKVVLSMDSNMQSLLKDLINAITAAKTLVEPEVKKTSKKKETTQTVAPQPQVVAPVQTPQPTPQPQPVVQAPVVQPQMVATPQPAPVQVATQPVVPTTANASAILDQAQANPFPQAQMQPQAQATDEMGRPYNPTTEQALKYAIEGAQKMPNGKEIVAAVLGKMGYPNISGIPANRLYEFLCALDSNWLPF